MDGRVVGGTSPVNQAPITGESVPVEKQPGDEVFAGTIKQNISLSLAIKGIILLPVIPGWLTLWLAGGRGHGKLPAGDP